MNLVTVQGSMLLDAPSANAWFAMEASCRRATGVDLTISSPAGAWRSEALVLDMYLHKANYGIPASQPVAKPKSLGGSGSVHENGRCVDINNWGDAAEWLRANSPTFGFRRTIATEPWHFQHDGTTAAAGGGAGGFIPIDDEVKQTGEDIMQTIYYQGPNGWGIFGPGAADPGWQETTHLPTAQAWGKRWGAHPISEEEKPKLNGAPWEHITDPAVWAAMKVQAEIERQVAKSLAANVTVPKIEVPPLVLDAATIAALAQANAAAFFAEQKKAGN